MEQLQQQVNQLMSVIMNKGLYTPEDHVSNIASLTYSMLSYAPDSLHEFWMIDTGTLITCIVITSLCLTLHPILNLFILLYLIFILYWSNTWVKLFYNLIWC